MNHTVQIHQSLGKKYLELEKQFLKFQEILNKPELASFFPSFSIVENKSENEIHIQFIGKRYVIRYEFVINNNADGVGVLASYSIDLNDKDKHLTKLTLVEFDRIGNARPENHSNGYLWDINSDAIPMLITLMKII